MTIARILCLLLLAATASAAATAAPLLTKAQIAQAARDLDACLAKAQDAKTCIGLIQKPCDDAISAGGELAHATCADNEEAAWEVLLNETWRTLPGEIDPEHVAALKDVQAQWLVFRESKCGFLRRARGGWGIMLAAHCRLDETSRRTLELRDLLGDPNFAAE